MKSEKPMLKDFINDEDFIEKINSAFMDLRADYELSMDVDRTKIDELRKIHIDNKNYLSDLQSYSKKASGVVSGLRGTGKTHLFLLARDHINQNMNKDKALCIYLNLKRLSFPANANQELVNRAFSIFIYNQISFQLVNILDGMGENTLWDKFKVLFNNDKKMFIKRISAALIKLSSFKAIAHQGDEEFANLDKGSITKDDFNKELLDFQNKIKSNLGIKDISVETDISIEILNEISCNISKNNTYQKYLNVESVRQQIIELLKILDLDSITLYIDEWEKQYYNPIVQEYLSFYIDRIIDTPIYCWIGIVPYRGRLYYLDNGADLQHYINLDESLVYENSEYDRKICISYFREFINKRLSYYLSDYYNYKFLFNDDNNLELLILASMGNSRDFGTMLVNCWSEYKAYRTNKLAPGRPYQYINHNMIVKSIKNNGDKKISNISDKSNILAVWRDIENYCIGKKSSHFAIEETKENIDCLCGKEFSELIYHRLLHFRKGHVPPKDTDINNKLSIYALSYTSIYDLHSKDRKITFITEYQSIHDRVRRYIYSPSKIISSIKIREGELFPCVSCKENINIQKMAAAWNNNSCPFCGDKIRNN